MLKIVVEHLPASNLADIARPGIMHLKLQVVLAGKSAFLWMLKSPAPLLRPASLSCCLFVFLFSSPPGEGSQALTSSSLSDESPETEEEDELGSSK
jgi:hypothetical protein